MILNVLQDESLLLSAYKNKEVVSAFVFHDEIFCLRSTSEFKIIISIVIKEIFCSL